VYRIKKLENVAKAQKWAAEPLKETMIIIIIIITWN
jgi:hypothetical protein